MQLYALLCEDKPDSVSLAGDPMGQLHRANHLRAEQGLKPVFPALMEFTLPRVKR
jgi:hypothetical protein